MDGAGAFLLFALYFANLASLRRGEAVEVEKYEPGIDELLAIIDESLDAIVKHDAVGLQALLDSFARRAVNLQLP